MLKKMRQKNVFYDILEERNAMLGCKNKNFKKKGKMDIFLKGG